MTDLVQYGSCTLEDDGCTTCGDVAVPVRVVAIESDGTAVCEDRIGHRATIQTAFTPEAESGDVLLVHMGVAISRIGAPAAGRAPTNSTVHPGSS